jgi:CRISPR-associated protein Csx3
MKKTGIHLEISQQKTPSGLRYQQLTIELTRGDRVIYPAELSRLELPNGIDTTQGVVINGRAPIWLYGYLIHELHPTAWVACNDPRLGAVVVATHSKTVKIGQVIPLKDPGETLNSALMIVGPPDSGKSVLAHALFQALLEIEPNIYLQRANWDGEGNYVLELAQDADPEIFKAANKGGLTPEFFPYHAQAILNLRRNKILTIVDVGGMVQLEKQPILEACTHYLIISSKPEAVEPWHEFCRDRGNLIPVAVIHSRLEPCQTIHQEQPYLEITCGPWLRGGATAVPEVLMERVKALLGSSL